MKTLKTQDLLLVFIVLVLLTILLGEMMTYILNLNELIYKDLSEQLTFNQIQEVMDLKIRWAWVGYVILPIMLLLKITIIAWILGIGSFFTNTTLSHKVYFQIVLKAEFVFLLAIALKVVWFKYIRSEFTIEEIQQFMPLSLQNIIDTTEIPTWAIYPLQLVSLFEVAYWILLAFLINKASKTNKGMKIVCTSYGPALLIWAIFIMFLTLNITV